MDNSYQRWTGMEDLNLNTPENPQNSFAEQYIQVGCPTCKHEYNVAIQDIKPNVDPKFACMTCKTRFGVATKDIYELAGTIVGYPLQMPQAPAPSKPIQPEATPEKISVFSKSLFNCPKCSAPYSGGQEECNSCGVVFFKFSEQKKNETRFRKEETFSASKEVRGLWEDVLSNYENQEVHENFISAAWADKCLDYAAMKYGSILEINPSDLSAQRYANEVRELVTVRFEVMAEGAELATVPLYAKPLAYITKYIKNFEFSVKKIKWLNLIFVFCGMLIATGIFMPQMRNLVGFGSSILFFILALRYYFRVI